MIIHQPKPPTSAMLGIQRARLRFAWWPVHLTGYRVCWLERYLEVWEVQNWAFDYAYCSALLPGHALESHRSCAALPEWTLRGRYAIGDALPTPDWPRLDGEAK